MDDEELLRRAINLAEQSSEPNKCGAVIVDATGNIIAEAYNSQRADRLTAAHAEMKAIAIANNKVGRKLKGLTIYCSCEPCTMCLSTLKFADINRIVFASKLKDLVKGKYDYKINLDPFDFLKKFPDPPILEYMPLD